mgnify:CR=1 FL=1
MTKLSVRRVLYRLFLALAYIIISLQWLWVLTLGLPLIIEAGLFDSFAQSAPPTPSVSESPAEFSPIVAIAAGVVTLVFLALTIVIFFKLPKVITDTGEKIIQQSAEAIVPVITQHKKLPAKKRRIVSRRVTRVLQIILIIVPLVASLFVPPLQTITSQIITTLAIWLAGISALCLVVSWLLEPPATSQTRSRASRG